MPSNYRAKYLKIEVIFFITYFYLFRLLTNFEYNFWEEKITGISRFDIEYSIGFGTSSLIAFLVFYEIIKNYLKNGRLFVFIGYTLLFLTGYSIFQKAAGYLFAHLDFLSKEMKKWAMVSYQSKSIGYSLAYMFREFLAIGFLAYFIHAAKQNEKMKSLKEQQLVSELSYLKTQLQPHFFFNTLNNIYSLALKKSDDTAPLIAKLAELMRYILYKSDHEFVPLNDEIAFLRNYIAVEKIRYPLVIKINVEIQGIGEESEISPLLLLPFIENAFKHGIQDETQSGYVSIVICKTEDELILEVDNSIPDKKSINDVGIALINAKKRLSLIYPKRHKLCLEETKEKYHVSLTLNL